MILDKDFIKRLIQQLARVLAAALNLRKAGKNEEALQYIRSASGDLLGLDWDVLQFGGMGAAVQLLQNPDRIRTYARLVEEEAHTLEAMGEREKAAESFKRARNLYEQVLATNTDAEAAEGRDRCDR